MPPRTNKHKKGVRGRRECQCKSLLGLDMEPLNLANGQVTLEWLKPLDTPVVLYSYSATLRFPIFNTCTFCHTNAFTLNVQTLDLNVSATLNEAVFMVRQYWARNHTAEFKLRCPAFNMMRDVPDNISFRELRLLYLGNYSLSEDGKFDFTVGESNKDTRGDKVLLLYIK